MIQQAQAELPNECCGILAGVREGDVLRVLKMHPLINEAASPIEYQSEPRSMFMAVKDMRQLGHDVLAVYHSHPASAPIPSKTDLERAYSPVVIHFIIGLSGPEPTLRGWWLSETAFEEAAWQLVDG
jgi:proteasome lid subunit RPN8/RPN11